MADPESKTFCRPDWLDLFRCFRIANDPVKIWLGFIGATFSLLVLLVGIGLLLEVRALWGGASSRAILQELRRGDTAAAWASVRSVAASTEADLKLDLEDVGQSLDTGELMPALLRASTLQKLAVWAAAALLLLWLPWAYFAGAINRGAAVEYATGERLTSADLREFAAARYGSYFWPPAAVLLAALALCALNFLIGLAAGHLLAAVAFVVASFVALYLLVLVKQKTSSSGLGALAGLVCFAGAVALACRLWCVQPGWLGWVSRVLLVLAFPMMIGLGIAVVAMLLVLVFGRGLMTSAVSYEGTGAFDALSRAGDAVLRRPWRLAFYTVVAAAYAVPCLAVVAFFTLAGFLAAALAVWLGFGAAFGPMYHAVFNPGNAGSFGDLFRLLPGFLLRVVFVLLCGFVAAWCVAFLHSFRVIAYALIRKSVDLSGPGEIYVDAGVLPAPPGHSTPAAP